MWQARLYYDTGFNSINVPDSEETLIASSGNIKTFSTMDILQRYFLSKITIRAFEDDVINADYLKIYDENNENKYAFYSINGYNMTSGDVVDLTVVMDPLLSCGGIENIDFADGMTRRHHVSDDAFGAYQEDDPLLIPKKVYCTQAGGYGDETDDMVIIAVSNYEIYHNSAIICNNNRHLQIISDGNDGWTVSSQQNDINDELNDMPIFKMDPRHLNTSGTKMLIDTPFGFDKGDALNNSYGDVYHVFRCKDRIYTTIGENLPNFIKQVNRLIEYGRNDIIKSIYLIPYRLLQSQGYGDYGNDLGEWTYADIDDNDLSGSEEGPFGVVTCNLKSVIKFDNEYNTMIYPSRKYNSAVYTNLMYVDQDYNHGGGDSDFYKDVDIHNKRVFYGKHFAYTFTSPTSGEKCTINPELLSEHPVVSPSVAPQGNLPYITFTVDIRENGKPTFYIYTNGDGDVRIPESDGTSILYRKMPKYKINGSTWPTMSISTIAAKDYKLNRNKYQFDTEASGVQSAMQMYHDINPIGDATFGKYIPSYIETGLSYTKPVDDRYNLGRYTFDQYLTGYTTPMLTSNVISDATSGNTLALNVANREIEKASEREKFISANLPQVEVISKSSGDGIVVPNGLLIYRNYIDEEDAKKFDIILNQFGYKITEPMKKEFLGNRLGYNYVEVSGASVVAKNVPKSVRKDLANLFSTGVRIWHKKPDYDYSKSNGINIHFNEEEVENND